MWLSALAMAAGIQSDDAVILRQIRQHARIDPGFEGTPVAVHQDDDVSTPLLYHMTLGRTEAAFHIPCPKPPMKLPVVLSRQEVIELFAAATNLRQRTLLKTTYSAGLRVSETVNLKVTDIDSRRMCIRVDQGKNQKDRYTLRSPSRA